MGGSPFLAFAEHRDLDYAECVADGAAGRFPLPHGEVSELVGGQIAPGREGIVGRLRRRDGDSADPVELTLVVTRIPESVERLGPVIKGEKGFLHRLLGSADSPEATMVALTAVLRSYGAREGLEHRYPDGLVELLPFFDHFPMSVMRLLSLDGNCPGTSVPGSLVAFLDLAELRSADGRAWPAFEIELGDAAGDFVHILPREGGDRNAPSAFGGFSVALGDGDRRETEASRREREEATALAESLGGRFDVVAHRPSGADAIGDAATAWLAHGAGDGLVLEGGRLTLVGAERPLAQWSFAMLDELCRSTSPVLTEIATTRRS